MRNLTIQIALNSPNRRPDDDRHKQRRQHSEDRNRGSAARRPAARDNDRADRQVHAGGEQHKGHADRDDPDKRRLFDDVPQVLEFIKPRLSCKPKKRKIPTNRMSVVFCSSRTVIRSRV